MHMVKFAYGLPSTARRNVWFTFVPNQTNVFLKDTPLYIIDMLKYIFKAKSKDITNITVTELLLLSVSIGMISGLVGYMIVNYGV